MFFPLRGSLAVSAALVRCCSVVSSCCKYPTHPKLFSRQDFLLKMIPSGRTVLGRLASVLLRPSPPIPSAQSLFPPNPSLVGNRHQCFKIQPLLTPFRPQTPAPLVCTFPPLMVPPFARCFGSSNKPPSSVPSASLFRLSGLSCI